MNTRAVRIVYRMPHRGTTQTARTYDICVYNGFPAVGSNIIMRHHQHQPIWVLAIAAAAWLMKGKALAFAARVLVTGGAGYIGSHTCVELIKAGEKVSCVTRWSTVCICIERIRPLFKLLVSLGS